LKLTSSKKTEMAVYVGFVFERDVIWRNRNFKGRYNSCSNVHVKRIIRCILIKAIVQHYIYTGFPIPSLSHCAISPLPYKNMCFEANIIQENGNGCLCRHTSH
jgi:hypothetical protein